MKSPNIPNSSKLEAWERFKKSQKWAADAPLPLMTRLFHVNRLVSLHFEDALNLSSPQLRILFEALEPQGVSQATICKNYKVDPASVTRTVQVMERDGLITRHPDLTDSRLMRVFITEKGRKLIEGMPEKVAQFEKTLVQDWTNAEILQLHFLLEKIENHYETEAVSDTVSRA